ncbi:acyl-CoA/acyl-ACP dehydrogenase [Frankia sp. AiPs1]|uniref:acyl-CoA dehydrogenase family protein n=1 Tax=Frankia sp. AiPs1 TaxID=573493 RepID=UPI002043DB79|nr:acyl-CoA dehydrogenase family protein [Frankia sp. AiPs1]MCM3921144.1 acyl-CoA/acyl-ACP dehydrogenase [Frankia sp. AiPs1]
MTGVSASLDDDQIQLQKTLRAALSRHCSGPAQLALATGEEDFDPALWKLLLTELDLVGLAAPERFGGGGAPLPVLGVALMELGRALYSGPYFSSGVLTTQAIVGSGDEAVGAEILPGLCRGEVLATVAGLRDDGPDGLPGVGGVVATAATADGDGTHRLTGVADHVWEAHGAHRFVVFASTRDGVGCFLTHPDAPGMLVERLPGMDLTRRLSRVRFAAAPARPLGALDGGSRALARLRRIAPVCLAAEQIGGAEHCLEQAVDHAKRRHQFGRPIGSFQAVKHQLASVLMDVEAAKAATVFALGALEHESPDAATMVHVAKAAASDAFFHAAGALIQTLGGIGYTWEHPAHLYLRRAVSGRAQFGFPSAHRRALGAEGGH